MAFSKAISASITVPVHWTLPSFCLGERVRLFDHLNRINIGVIRGMEFIDSEYNRLDRNELEEGWWYSVLIDEDSPTPKLLGVTQKHQNELIKYPSQW